MSKARTTADLVNQSLATQTYADGKVADAINDSTTTIAPSENAVFDALALKTDKSATAYSFGANNTSGTANKTDQIFKDVLEQTYSGAIAWTATTVPSGSTTHTYQWTQLGKFTALRINLKYATPGVADTAVTMALPSDCPTPYVPGGFGGADAALLMGKGNISATLTAVGGTSVIRVTLRTNPTNSGYLIYLATTGTPNAVGAWATIIYWSV